MSENNNSDNKVGCTIALIVGVVVAIIWGLCTTSKDAFAEMGGTIMGIAAIAIVYFICKAIGKNFSDSSIAEAVNVSNTKGCLIGILIVVAILALFVLVYHTIATNFELNVGVGILFFIALSVGIAIYFWNSVK